MFDIVQYVLFLCSQIVIVETWCGNTKFVAIKKKENISYSDKF